MVADTQLPTMNKLYIDGVLELEYQINSATGQYYNFVLSCDIIFISGGRLIIGWEDNVFLGQAEIILRGSHISSNMVLPDGQNIGSKALGKCISLKLLEWCSWYVVGEERGSGWGLRVVNNYGRGSRFKCCMMVKVFSSPPPNA